MLEAARFHPQSGSRGNHGLVLTSLSFCSVWCPSPSIEQPTFRAGLPPSVKALWKHPHSHVCSLVTPNPVS